MAPAGDAERTFRRRSVRAAADGRAAGRGAGGFLESRATVDRIAEAYGRMDRFKHGAGDLIGADLDFHMAILEATDNRSWRRSAA